MINKDIPVVLVVAGRKIKNIERVVNRLYDCCGFWSYYVICPTRDIESANKQAAQCRQEITVIDENLIVPGMNLYEVKKRIKLRLENWPENHLAGWYFQQFLKMGFSQYASGFTHYLIWDADTLVTRNIPFFEGESVLLTQGNEFHREYFDTIRSLLGNIEVQPVSHISQHLMVKTGDMRSLIEFLSQEKSEWWVKVLLSLKGNTPFQFSEYETYANFCLSTRAGCYKSIKRSWFRYGKSFLGQDLPGAETAALSGMYDFVAFEDWDAGVLRTLRSHVIVAVRRFNRYIHNLMKSS